MHAQWVVIVTGMEGSSAVARLTLAKELYVMEPMHDVQPINSREHCGPQVCHHVQGEHSGPLSYHIVGNNLSSLDLIPVCTWM